MKKVASQAVITKIKLPG